MDWRRHVALLALVIHVLAVGVPCGADLVGSIATRTSEHHVADGVSSHAGAGLDHDPSAHTAHTAHHVHHALTPEDVPPAGLPQLVDDGTRIGASCDCGCSAGRAERGAPGARLGSAILAASWERAPEQPRPALPLAPPSAFAEPASLLDPVPV